MAEHTAYDLKQMQSLPLEAKINMTKRRIQEWYEAWKRYEIYNENTKKTRFVTATDEPKLRNGEFVLKAIPGQVYVSFSGGKDSTVLKHIVDSMYDDVPALFVNTGLEYPEIQKFAMSQKNVTTVRPTMRFDEVLTKYGYPVITKECSKKIYDARRGQPYAFQNFKGKMLDGTDSKYAQRFIKYERFVHADFDSSHKCCDVMKKNPAKAYEKEVGRKPILGTMASESFLRQQHWVKQGCNAFETDRPVSAPLSFWTEQDVLKYIMEYDIPYCSVYGDIVEENGKLITTGYDRTGCIFCMYGCHRDPSPNRFQRLATTHPRQYEYCIGGGEMVDGKWQPSKEGLGLGHVLDFIGVDYKCKGEQMNANQTDSIPHR